MTNRFMISVAAAALIAGAGFANAQGTGTGQQGSSGSTASRARLARELCAAHRRAPIEGASAEQVRPNPTARARIESRRHEVQPVRPEIARPAGTSAPKTRKARSRTA